MNEFEKSSFVIGVLVLMTIALNTGIASATIIRVPADYPAIQAGINAASIGDTVLVAPGTYFENIYFNGRNILVGSLFITTGDTSYITRTVIDGNKNESVVAFNHVDSTAILSGFTITNGSSDWDGGGINCYDHASPSLENLRILNNSAAHAGGGISCRRNCNPYLKNVEIRGNSAIDNGGGLVCHENSRPTLEEVMILNNTSNDHGGGMAFNNSDPFLRNVIVTNNYAKWSGGIHCRQSSPNLANVIISQNSAEWDGGFVCWDNSNPNLINVTITGNSANGTSGGIFCGKNSNPILLNAILWNNSPQEIALNLSSITISYSNVRGGAAGTGNIDQNPLFADEGSGDYHLQLGSPCIDAGDPDLDGDGITWQTDPDDQDPDYTRMDMGAYYYNLSSTIRITTGDIVNDGGDSRNVSWSDYDNDGNMDLFVSNFNLPEGQNNFLYRNNGDGSFIKITEGDIVNDGGISSGSSWGDYDNDGDSDLFVVNFGNNFLYANNGDGSFTKIAEGDIVNDGSSSHGASWGDYDNDGDLDLFVANWNNENNFLYANNGDGTFTRITTGTIVNDGGNSTGCIWGDYDNDGYLDLFVANEGNNFLYANNGDGGFNKITTGSIVTDGGSSLSSSFGDYDNDGDLDLFVANKNDENDLLYSNNGDGTFTKITTGDIVNDGSNSHGANWGDYDNDGYLDLFVANHGGNNFLYRNNGDGTFNKVTAGHIVNDGIFSQGSSWADYDNDGDLDLFVGNVGNNFLYANNGYSNNWINIKCNGTVSNRSAVGTKVRVKATINGRAVWQLNEISGQTGGGFGGQNSLNTEFGLGDATIIDSLKIEWSSGIVRIFMNIPVNQFLTVRENNSPVVANEIPDINLTINGDSFTRDLNTSPFVFTDPDGEELSFSAFSSNDSVATATVNGSLLTVSPIAVGSATITVTAIDDRGGSTQTTFKVTVTDPSAPPVIIHTPPFSVQQEGQNILIGASITGNIASAALNYRQGGKSSFAEASMSKVEGLFQANIAGNEITSLGVEYFIEAKNLVGVTSRSPASGIYCIQVNVPDPGVVKGTAQPGGNEQTAYRIISVPLDLVNKDPGAVLENDLGEYDITEWRFYEVQSDQSRVEFPNTSPMTPGKAFWLIVKDSGKRISTGEGKSNSTSKEFTLPLHSQWNTVGNPFNFTIPINKIRLSSGQTPELRFFTGSWNDPINAPVTLMQPFEGYAIFSDSTIADTLFINPDLSTSSSVFTKNTDSISENILWSIRILAECQQARDVDNIAAVSSGSSSGWDALDRPEPPVIGEYVSVYFPHPEWETLSEFYCTDFRPELFDGEVWEFEVKTNVRDVVHLSFDGLEQVPQEFEIWMVDETLEISQNLRETNSYLVVGSHSYPKRLKLVVGKRDFVGEKLAVVQSIPTTCELSQNFPNPFNPTTTIRYGLPAESRVTLKIYNLLGEEVVTLVNDEQKAAGYHVTVWDGRNQEGNYVASGLYFYHLQIGSFSMTKKMALMK